MHFSSCRRMLAVVVIFGALGSQPAGAADASEFARSTIDLGMLVSDAARSVKFYTEAIGFSEAPGFTAPAELCAQAGLDDQNLNIHVLVLGDGPSATKLKLMEVKGVDSKKNENAMIHSQLGYRYLTVFVTDANAALARLQKAGVKPLAKGPVQLPANLGGGMTLSVVRDPDGNMIELIGPKK